ncbi:MAG: DNA polymerase III subunit gamma/tau [bacterium]|nr:DNA polymerase III subunit gamma/tau [bacterium]
MNIPHESYTVLARKWRPQTFAQVIGQEHVTTTLQNAITQGRFGQGYLFIGTRGVGKTTIARILAKALNCLSAAEPTPTPCGTCANCVAIRDGACLDVMEIDGASNRGIEEIRRLRDSVAIAPVSARYKVYIIDEVHMLTKEAFNALLKTLEEPPPHVKFFFATTEPHKIPATILSRVQKHELRRVAWDALVAYLEKVATAEGVTVERGALGVIARAGDGSVRDTLSVFDQVLALAAETITEAEVTALLGWTERETYFALHHALVAEDVAGALAIVQHVIERGRDPEQFILGLLDFLRSMLVVQHVTNPETVLEETAESLRALQDAAQRYTHEQLLYSMDVLLETLPRLAATEAKQTALELALLKIVRARRRVSLDSMLERLQALDGAAAAAQPVLSEAPAAYQPARPAKPAAPAVGPPAAPAAVPPAAAAAPATVPAAKAPAGPHGDATLAAAWKTWLAGVATADAKLHALIAAVMVADGGPDTLRMLVPHDAEMTWQALAQKKTRERLGAEISRHVGRPVAFEIVREQPPSTATAPLTRDDMVQRAKQEPLVQKALEIFGGEIIDVQE